MRDAMVASGLGTVEVANAFFASMDKPLEIPSDFVLTIADLIPGDSGRGKKAGDIFSAELPVETDEDDDDEVETAE